VVSEVRVEEVDALLASLRAWGRRRGDVRAVALVGSWAYRRPRGDSDVDLVLLTEAPNEHIDSDEWLTSLGAVRLVWTQRRGCDHGAAVCAGQRTRGGHGDRDACMGVGSTD
jgi:hypothetical protein